MPDALHPAILEQELTVMIGPPDFQGYEIADFEPALSTCDFLASQRSDSYTPQCQVHPIGAIADLL